MQTGDNRHPNLHRRLAWYHFRKWWKPESRIPIPTMDQQHKTRILIVAAILGVVVGIALVVGGAVTVETDVRVYWGW